MNDRTQSSPGPHTLLPPTWVLFSLAVVLTIWLVYTLKEIVVLLVLGYCIAYLIDPAVSYLERKKVRRGWGVLVVFAFIITVAVLLVLTTFPMLARESAKLASNFPEYVVTAREKAMVLSEQFRSRLPAHLASRLGRDDLLSVVPAPTASQIRAFLFGMFNALLGGYSLLLMAANLLLLPFITFYLAVDFKQFHAGFLRMFPYRLRQKVETVAQLINRDVSAFVRGQFIVALLLCVLYSLGLGLVGVEMWFLLAIITGLGNFVPYVGSFVGIVLSIIMALVTFGDLSHVLQVLVVFAVVQFIEGNFITPKVVGERVGLSPLAVILAIFVGGKLFGLLGVFLAVPGAAAFKVVWRQLHAWLLTRSELAPT